MSLTDNTANLNEVLQKVRALPEAGSGGGSLGKVLLGEVTLNSTNITANSNNPGMFNFDTNLQTIMSSIFSNINPAGDVIVFEYHYSAMGVIQTQTVATFEAYGGQMRGISLTDSNGTIWIYPDSVAAAEMYLDFLNSVISNGATFTFKVYKLIGGSSNSGGSLNKVLLEELILDSTSITETQTPDSTTVYFFNAEENTEGIVSSILSKCTSETNLVIADISCSMVGIHNTITPCDIVSADNPIITIYGSELNVRINNGYITPLNEKVKEIFTGIIQYGFIINIKFYALAGGSGGSGSSATPDWNVHDEDAPGYIKNRPFYDGGVGVSIIVEPCEVTLTEEYIQLPMPLAPIGAGQVCVVTVNGQEYTCRARDCEKDTDKFVLLGNGTIYGDGNPGNNEPFAIDYWEAPDGVSDANDTIYLNAAPGTYTISIYSFQTVLYSGDITITNNYSTSGEPALPEMLQVGVEYTVTFGSYSSTLVGRQSSSNNLTYIGTPAPLGGEHDGTPLCIIHGAMYAEWENGTYRLTICQPASTLHQLDEKFIPDTIARIEYVDYLYEWLQYLSEVVNNNVLQNAGEVLF